MERLTERRLRRLLGFLEGLAAVSEENAFVSYLLTALPTVVRAEILTYNQMCAARRESWDRVTATEFNTPEQSAIWAAHMHEHPMLMHELKTGDGTPRMMSEFLSVQQLHRTGLYNELYKGWRTEDVLTTSVTASGTPTTLIGVGWYRNKRTFSEQDRTVVTLLKPHLAQAYARVRAQYRVRESLRRSRQALESLDEGIVIISRDGSIRDITARGRGLLLAHWGPQAAADVLPQELKDWVRSQRGPDRVLEHGGPPAAPEPLVLTHRRGLVVRLATHGPHEDVLVLEEPRTSPAPSALPSLGLTPRESEVLLWVSRGKSNQEIALILGASPRTIHKHLEHIYQKLGVETRTAAAIRVWNAPR